MTTKHTPGEWKVTKYDNDKLLFDYSVSVGNTNICKIHRHNSEFDEANATLIAAAPYLYDALKDGVELIEYLINATPTGKVRDSLCDFNIIARNALNKATL